MAYTKDEKGREKALPKKTPAPARNTFLPGNPTAGEFGRRVIKQKEREITQPTQPQSNPKSEQPEKKSYTGTNPYYPKKAPTGKYTSNKKVKVGGNDVNSSKKRIAEAFGSAAKTKSGKLVSGSNVNTGHGKVKKSGKGNNSFTMTAPKASKSKKSKKR